MVIGVAIAAASTAYSIYSGIKADRAAKKQKKALDRGMRAAMATLRNEQRFQRMELAERLYRTGRGDAGTIQSLMETRGLGKSGYGQFSRATEDRALMAGRADARRLLMAQRGQLKGQKAGIAAQESQSVLDRLNRTGQYLQYGAGLAALGAQAYNYFQPTHESIRQDLLSSGEGIDDDFSVFDPRG